MITGEPNEVMQPIHDRLTTILEPHDYQEYLAPAKRPPVHLLSIFRAERMSSKLVGQPASADPQLGLFDPIQTAE